MTIDGENVGGRTARIIREVLAQRERIERSGAGQVRVHYGARGNVTSRVIDYGEQSRRDRRPAEYS